MAAQADGAFHVALHRQIDLLRPARPRRSSAVAVKRIITSGPQTMATVWSGSKPAREISFGTTPTSPCQLASA